MPEDNQGQGPKTFTQEEVNSMLAADRRKHEEKVSQAAKDVETLTSRLNELTATAQMTDEQRTQLANQLEEIKQRGLTDQQRWQQKEVELNNRIKEVEITGKKESETWKNRFTSRLTTTTIYEAAQQNGERPAVRKVEPVAGLLAPYIQVEEVEGEFVPVVKGFPMKDDKGKTVKKDVLVRDAIDYMYSTEDYKYLFQDNRVNGDGSQESQNNSTDSDVPPKDPAQYREWRKKHMGRR